MLFSLRRHEDADSNSTATTKEYEEIKLFFASTTVFLVLVLFNWIDNCRQVVHLSCRIISVDATPPPMRAPPVLFGIGYY